MNRATVSVERRAATAVVQVRGEIDLLNAETVRTDVLGTMPPRGPMILDLTQSTHLDSIGIRLLFDVAEHLQARHQRLVLVVGQEALIRRVVVLTKFDEEVAVVATVDEALSALNASS